MFRHFIIPMVFISFFFLTRFTYFDKSIVNLSVCYLFCLLFYFSGANPQQNGINKDVERLEDDIRSLNNMLNLSDTISIPHQVNLYNVCTDGERKIVIPVVFITR